MFCMAKSPNKRSPPSTSTEPKTEDVAPYDNSAITRLSTLDVDQRALARIFELDGLWELVSRAVCAPMVVGTGKFGMSGSPGNLA
jgi:hypothetical protein